MKKKVPSIASNLFYKNLKKFIYCLLFLAPTLSFSQYDMDLFLQFNGNYDFTAIGNTLNPAPNPCNILTESSADLTLESTQSIVSAHLYWAGSGSIDFGAEYPSDRIVFLNGNEVRSSRQFQVTANFGGGGRDYFSYYTNVTEFVTGNGEYTLSGFDITDNIQGSPGGPYCGSGTDFGGWSIIIIYEDPNLALNQISLFDGYELVYGDPCCNNIEIILDGIDVASDELAKIGFLAWEGDEGIANNETLRINDVPISNAQNPLNNAFNGSNSYTGSNDLFNMDLDVYDLEGIVEPDDTEVQINLTSDQDLIIINNLIISVNSELPDATIEFDPVVAICDDGGLEINYTVSNVNSTKFLPAGVNIAFYAETTAETILLDTAITNSILAIGESESGSINLTVPIGDPGFPDIFTLKAVVDDDGTGIGNVSETNEGNNEFLQEIDLSIVSVNLGEDILIDEGNAVCEGIELEIGIVPGSLGENGYQWYFINSVFVEEEIPGATESYLTITETGRYILKTTAYLGTSTECIISGDIFVEFIPFSPAVEPDPIVICDDPFDDFGEFDLTVRDVQIINDQPDTSVTYYILEADAEEGNTNFIDPPNAFPSTSVTVYARLATDVGDCFSVVPLQLQVSRPIAIANPITEFFICDNDQSGDEIFNLTEKYDEIVDGLEFIDLTYYNSESDAEVPQNPILTPDNYSSGGETIWVRAESIDGCTAIGFFELVLGGTPEYQEVPLFQLCDDAVADGFTDFDLEIQTPIIQDGDTNLIVTYHLDPLDAEAGTIPSLSSPYTNIINPESIWVRVEDPTLLCYDTFRMVLEVISLTGVVPDELFSCDEVPNDGFADFDLTVRDAQIINGQPNTFVTYYEDVVDAEAGNTNFIALPTAFENTTIDTQIVFARLEETILGCYDVVELVLTVNAAPAITDPIEDYALCDNDEDLTEIFDLTSKYDEIVNTLSDITLTYYNSEASAEVPRNPILTPDNYPSTGAEVIWFRAVNLEGCATIGFFNLIIDTVPIFQEVPLFQLCDDAVADGFTDFDLEIQTPIIQDGDTNLIVTYHLDPLDAEAGTIPSLSSPYTNIINPESIWVRVEDATTTCFGTFEMVLEVISVTGVVPDELFSCDEVPNDGFADFDLTVRDAQIINGQPNTFVTYYEDVVDAEAGNTNFIALPTAFENTTIDTQIVFARLEETILGCYDVVELVLTVNAAPAITDPIEDYALCDNDEDLTEIFDLTSKYDEIVNTLSDITLTYYNSEASAEVPSNPILTPDNYPSTGAETIWVRAVNLEGCATIGFFNLIIDTVPIFQEVPLFQLCDDAVADGFTDFDLEIQTPIIQGGDTNLIVTYHLDPLDAEAGTIPSLSSPYTNIINPESIWVRVEDATTTCFGTFEMVLEVISLTGVVPDELFSCDEVPNDGFADFDLTVRDAQIINGQPNTFVTYYEDVVDAEAGNTNFIALPTAFENTTIDTQIVFARLEETILGCYDVVELVLTVNAAPAITDPIEDYALCDNDEDLTEIFDLTSKYDEIVNTLSDITLTYYNSEASAEVPSNPILTPDNYPSTGAETIWFRAVNLEGCATIGFFNLIIDTVPIFQEVPLFQLCDDAVADGFTDFDLEIQTPIIQDGDTNLIVTYHLDPLDAEAGTIPSLSSPYTNIINPESIWVRVEDATTTCFGTFEMVLEVISVTGVVPDELFSCDEVPNDGFADFDLTVRDAQIINGQPNTFVTYYEDVVDAEAGNTNFIALPTAFENTTIDTQIVFARLEETILGCYDVVELVLTVNAAPAITDPIEDYALCDNDEDLTEIFDLTSKYDEIVNTLSDITLTYYNSEASAEVPSNPILTPDNYPSTGAETIWVRAVNLEGCATIGFFNLIIDTVPIFQEVPLFQLCDDAVADGFTDFDLEIQTPIIQGGDTNLIVTYHLDPLDAEAGTIPSLSSPYTNIINPESIWVRVEDATTTCFGTFEMELLVNPLPSPVTPTPLIECDLDNDDFIAFDLESKNTEILDGEPGVIISYHETRPEAENGTNEQSSPYTNINFPIQTIFARVEFTATGCFDIVTMDLVVNPTPIIPATINPIEICDVNLDGIEFFDLTERANEIYGPQDPADYTLRYYTDPIDADLGDPIDAIVTPDAYPNTGNPETIWVRLENNLTGCYSVGSFIIDFIFCPQPDATIQIGNIGVFCASSNLDITYTVFNVNSTGPLPANTPIAFYADGILLGQSLTINEIPIDGSETLTISLFIPPGTPFIFTLKGVVDDDGTGTGIVGEDDETNNEFEITVDLDGERINLGPDIESCIGYTEVLDADLGAPGFNYQWFFDGALIPGATDPIFSATTNGTYSVTATDGVCFVEGDIVLNFNAPPIAVFPDVLVVCDAFPNDEFASFDLTDRDFQIIDGQPDTFVTYYLTASNADTATDPLGIPYTNVDPGTQTVFARLEGIPVGCYDVVPLLLQVDAAPAITDPISDYFICDNDQNNTEIFDLTSKYDEIVNTLSDITLTYYNLESDAIDGLFPILAPEAYTSVGLETIWIRAENLEGCITISSFILISGDVPVIQPVLEFLVCDDDLLDGITEFNLDSQNNTIVIGDPNLLVTYHTIPLDAEDGSNILASPYTNTVNPETLYVRVIDNSTGCYIVFEMDLKVITPVAVVPDDLLACDEVPNDGFAEFNLRDRDEAIIDGQDAVITYYENLDDADAGNANFIAVPTAFENTTVDTQVVFARLEEPILGCYDVVELVLTVNAAPAITDPIEDYALCDNDEDLTEIFDLTSKYDEIVNTLADITLSYYNLETDANEEINEIAIPDAYTSAGAETIWFRAVNLEGCATIGSFNLIINIVPTYTEVPLYELCDDGISDGFTEFDLESQITTITNDDFNLIVTFHISQDDADIGENILESPYTNVTDPETIFVRVEDATTGCYGSFEMILDIISPIAIQPDPLEYCDPDNDGFGEFTLTDADSQVTGGIPLGNLQVSYHYLLEDAQNGVNPLASPYLNDVPFNQIVFVRLIDQTTGCYGTTTLELIVLDSPQIIQPSDLEQCDDDGDGVGEFDLTQSELELIKRFGSITLWHYLL